MKKLNKKSEGITLITLVITIIVLLILAGISIAMLTGENGILNRAKEASEKTEIATEKEQRQLAMYEASMNLTGMTFQGVEIPVGFAPTRIAGESTVDEGLVIIDSKGNEFVWIPCEYDSNSQKDTENPNDDPVYYNDAEDEGIDGKHDNRDSTWRYYQTWYNGGTWYDGQPHTIGMNSIKTHHGFYVARYEAGVPEEAEFYVSEDMTGDDLTYKDATDKNATDKIETLAPVSKKENQVWNFISQTNAKIVAGNMVDNSDVKSYLIDSHAWNTICRLLEKKETTKNLKDSTTWGNYYNNTTTKYEKLKGLWADYDLNNGINKQVEKYENTAIPKKMNNRYTELATGICDDFKVYNIYDLAGNMWEWTTETGKRPESNDSQNNNTMCYENDCTKNQELEAPDAVSRGGSFAGSGIGGSVVSTYGNEDAKKTDYDVSFRVVLYLK